MALIERIELTRHQLALDPAYEAAWDRRPRRAFPVTVYRVFDRDGRCGVAAGDSCAGLDEHLELFVGREASDLRRHAEVLSNLDFLDGRPWPLDLALWDLVGKTEGRPLWQMVGAHQASVRPYASSGSHWRLEEVDERVDHLLDRGFGGLKLRFGRPRIEDDLAVLERAREAAGDRLQLMVDCNQGWRMPWDTHPAWDLAHAIRVGRRLEDLDVRWMEEPLHRSDVEGMVELRSRVGVPIAGGEMTRDPFLLDMLLRQNALDVYQPDVAVTMGVARMVRFAHAVAEAGHVFSPHTWGAGTVLVANAHLAAGTVGTPWLEYPYDPPTWGEDRRDFMLCEPFTPADDGRLQLGDAPGLGIVLDEERLAATASARAGYA